MPLTKTAPASMTRVSRRARSRSVVHRAAPRPYSVRLASVIASSASATRVMAATGPKGLLVESGHPGADVVEDGGRVVAARTVRDLAAEDEDSAGLDGATDLVVQGVAEIGAGHRADRRLGVGGVAYLQFRGGGREGGDERVGHCLLDDEPLGVDAGLADVDVPGLDGGGGGGRDVRVGEHDERVGAAKFEDLFLQRGRGLGGDDRTDLGGPGEGDRRDARVGDDSGDLVDLDEQGAAQSLGGSGFTDHLLDGEGALRHVVGVLEQGAVAGRQGGGGEAEELPEGVVPRHDGEDDTERVVDDGALGGVGGDGSVGELLGGVLGVVLAGRRALLDLGACFGDRLAHLGGDERRVVVLAVAQDAGHLPQQGVRSVMSRRRQAAWASAAASRCRRPPRRTGECSGRVRCRWPGRWRRSSGGFSGVLDGAADLGGEVGGAEGAANVAGTGGGVVQHGADRAGDQGGGPLEALAEPPRPLCVALAGAVSAGAQSDSAATREPVPTLARTVRTQVSGAPARSLRPGSARGSGERRTRTRLR